MAFPHPALLLCLLILPSVWVFAQTRSNITVGDSLISGSNSSWVISPSGDFALGFHSLGDDDELFLLSTWYVMLPDTIVWCANGDNPAPKGSKVLLTADRGLVLTSPDGGVLWKPDNLYSAVSHGVLNDDGNFVLEDSKFSSVWETFKNPSDTLLPSQILEKNGTLLSRLSDTNYSRGRFELVFQNDGNLVFHSINIPSDNANENYYESDTVKTNTSSPGFQLVFNKSGDMYILRENGERFNLSDRVETCTLRGEDTINAAESYLRATLDFDGIFTLYQHPKSSSGNWTPILSLPDNICLFSRVSSGSGVCGYNSICILNDHKRPICQCPRGYSLLNPKDPYGSCKPDFIQGCEEDDLSQRRDLYEFEELTNVDWPLSDYVLLRPFTEEKCKQSCMEDCFCAVAIFRLGDSCWKKQLPLSNGRSDVGLDGGKAFIKVRKDNSSLLVMKKNQNTLILVGSVLLGSSVFVNFLLIGAICLSFFAVYGYKKKLKRMKKGGNTVEKNLRCFSYKELEEATNGFSEELGRGSFGVVYKGVINLSSCTHVAVKKLNRFLLQDIEKEFRTEVDVIGQTNHRNLVRLIGFCEDGVERLLVYECMRNGNLASLLFSEWKPSWNLRLEIAIGIARGLLYLHEESRIQVIHCDIKPQNILLDDSYNARISDFGLAKILKMNQSETNTAIRGTKGYVASEWFRNMPITAKVDVYSFGVLLLEIICCRRSVDYTETHNEEKAVLTDWAYDCYREGDLDSLVEYDKETLNDRKNLEKLVMIAMWCIQEDPALRPTMRKVTQMLEGVVKVLVPPCPSPFAMGKEQYSGFEYGTPSLDDNSSMSIQPLLGN